MAVLGSGALLQVEIDAGVEVFELLEPEVQKGFIALFHLFHKKQRALAEVQTTQNAKVLKGLSSTSLDAETPSAS